MPRMCAPSTSAWRARRLRSRQVICKIGSTPASKTAFATASEQARMIAPEPSVTLIASTNPFTRSTAASISERSVPFGGLTSIVTRNRPFPSFCSNRSFSASVIEHSGTQAHRHLGTWLLEFIRLNRVLHHHHDGHRADPAGDGRDEFGARRGLVKLDVPHDPAARHVDPHRSEEHTYSSH